MFTGLVEEIGRVESVQQRGDLARVALAANQCASDAELGDSICVNGCCLTVVELSSNGFAFDAVQETLDRTNLGRLEPGSSVNLERSMKPESRLGGHFVTGHIDGLGSVAEIEDHGEWQKFWFETPADLSRQMASKGSIAIDGISLTLVDVTDTRFSIAVIPHTLQVTTLGERNVGDSVNLETDLLAKYVQRQLAGFNSDPPA